MNRGPLRRVIGYVWDSQAFRFWLTYWDLPIGGARGIHECSAARYWEGELTPKTDGRKGHWIVVKPEHAGWIAPDFELLECGHEKPVPIARGEKYFNLRRRCPLCAWEAAMEGR